MTRHPRKAARRDSNEPEIVEVLLALGCSVHYAYDNYDLTVGIGNPPITVCVEVKQPGGKLTEKERTFRAEHRGQYRILRTVDEAVRMVEHYRNGE